ncbi:MAG: CoA activase [Desulfobulbaceae bacterium]|nr:MAG: CoA activase [Desulfobulbaceae bacterium]
MNDVRQVLGIDIGSVAVGMAVVTSESTVFQTIYRFHHGDVKGTVLSMLAEIDLPSISHVAATASAPGFLRIQRRCNNQIACVSACRHLHPGLRGMLLVGGEKFSFSEFDSDGQYLGSRSNTSCAAGTGSFLDQQAGRLGLSGVEELGRLAAGNCEACPQIASRCAVFAKTDLIHAQQEGYRIAQISDGLCRGLAKNIVDTLALNRRIEGDVIFCGGVGCNPAVVKYVSQFSGLTLKIPEKGHVYGAIGCAFVLMDDLRERRLDDLRPLVLKIPEDLLLEFKATPKEYQYPPLQVELSAYPDFAGEEQYEFTEGTRLPVEVDLYAGLAEGSRVEIYLGMDIGSTSTKAVLMDRSLNVLAGLYTRTAGQPVVAVQDIFRAVEAISRRRAVKFEVIHCGTTGSGRKFVGKIIGADAVIDEITAHARAACQLNPEVDTIIEIGGQDAKFTTMRDGQVTFSTMNNVCAAGTGSFIEEQALRLGCHVREYSRRAENTPSPLASDRCTVFMERDINHYLSEGYAVDEVLASALHSVCENYLLKVATEKLIGSTIYFQGATAKNKALVAAFEQRLGRPILVSKFCHLTGALGTALILHDELQKSSSSFIGFDLWRREIKISGEVCDLCTNHCKISIANIDGSRVAYGFLCGRDDSDTTSKHSQGAAFSLLRERGRISAFRPEARKGKNIVVGLPAAVHMVDDLPFWRKFFDLLGIRTVSSESYRGGLKAGKSISRAEFCAPVASMHGHIAWLLERVDFVFLPIYLETRSRDGRRQYCYYTQFLAPLVSQALDGEEGRVLTPLVKYLYTSFHAKVQLYRMLRKISRTTIGFLDVSMAYDRAGDFDRQCREGYQEICRQRLATGSGISVVLVGRPYTVLSPGLNCGIPEIFASLGIDAYYQDMLPVDPQQTAALKPLLQELHWEHASKILEAASMVAASDGLYPVYVTSFKCSPDSFGVEYFKAIMEAHGKPYLILELDEHDSSVGYETRIEAAIRAFRNHHRRQAGRRTLPVDYAAVNPSLEPGLTRKNVVFPNWDRLTCSLLTATLRREGYNAILMEESEQSIRESLKHNTGQCIPLNAIAQGYMNCIDSHGLDPADTVLWLNRSTLACNIRLYPHHIRQILRQQGRGMEEAAVFSGQLSFSDISLKATMSAYFAYMFGGMLRKVACRIRPYEREKGETDRVLDKSIRILSDAFEGKRDKEDALAEIISHFEWIDTISEKRPKVAIFGDLYVRDNRVMNQDLIRFIEQNGGEVITTPYSCYAKMIACTYFRKWFNEGKYLDLLSYRTLLATMTQMEKAYFRIFNRILGEEEFEYADDPEQILAEYRISVENTGESMDNLLKIHYIKKHYPDVALFVQTSPALCCASLITEAMRGEIERRTGVPVVSITYDGIGGLKNEAIIPYLAFPRKVKVGSGDIQSADPPSREPVKGNLSVWMPVVKK